MCTCTVTGTSWREPDVSATGPRLELTYSRRDVRGAETDYSLTPGEIAPPDEATLSSQPRRPIADSVSISESTGEGHTFTELV